MTSGLFTVDFSDIAIAIPRGIDASGRHIAGECVLGVSVAGLDFAGEKLAYVISMIGRDGEIDGQVTNARKSAISSFVKRPLPAGIAADNSTIVAQFCVQVRKIAIRITMTAITATKVFVSVTNV